MRVVMLLSVFVQNKVTLQRYILIYYCNIDIIYNLRCIYLRETGSRRGTFLNLPKHANRQLFLDILELVQPSKYLPSTKCNHSGFIFTFEQLVLYD